MSITDVGLIIFIVGQLIYVQVELAKLRSKMIETEKELNQQGKDLRQHERFNEKQFELYRNEVVDNHKDMDNKIQEILKILLNQKQ